jgi:hypothetical protein
VDNSFHQAVPFELPKLLAKHFLGDSRHHAAKLEIAHDRLTKEAEYDRQLPSSLQFPKRTFDLSVRAIRPKGI